MVGWAEIHGLGYELLAGDNFGGFDVEVHYLPADEEPHPVDQMKQQEPFSTQRESDPSGFSEAVKGSPLRNPMERQLLNSCPRVQ